MGIINVLMFQFGIFTVLPPSSAPRWYFFSGCDPSVAPEVVPNKSPNPAKAWILVAGSDGIESFFCIVELRSDQKIKHDTVPLNTSANMVFWMNLLAGSSNIEAIARWVVVHLQILRQAAV